MKGPRILGFLGLAALGSMAPQAIGQETEEVKKAKPMVAVLGAETRAPTEEEVEEHGLVFKVRAQGQVVVSVAEDGPAHEAGLVAGDIIVKLDENDIYSQDDITDFLHVSRPGRKVIVNVRSPDNDDVEKVKVSLGGRESTADSLPQFRWQFASLGQLPKAMEKARAEKKKVLVGLSGAET